MSTIANMPKVKEALDNLREVLETERRDRIEFLRSCISSWRADIERAEKLPEQIARSEAEIAELERMRVPDHASLVPVVGGSRMPPSLLNQLNAAQTELRDGVGKVKEKAAAREAEIAERLAALLGNVNLACYGVDDLVGRLRDELADLDWMSSAKRMAGG